jgi:hypothetical protein
MKTINKGSELNKPEFNSLINTLFAEDIKERKDIAQLFHNKKGILAVLLLNMQKHKQNIKNKTIKTSDFNKDVELIKSLVEELKTATYKIYPLVVKYLGVFKGLSSYAVKSEDNGLAKIKIINSNPDYRFDEQKEVNIYKVLCETIDFMSTVENSKITISTQVENNKIYVNFVRGKKVTLKNDGKEFEGQLKIIKARLFYLQAVISETTNWSDFIGLSFNV